MMSADVLKQLAALSDGLEYPSESDAPFEAFCWTGKWADARGAIAERAKGRVILETTAEEFFAALDDSENGKRFREMQRGLVSLLKELKVFRVGEIRVEVYLIGKTAAGEFAGLKTLSVET